MSSNPVNLAVRFLLELCILAALGIWGWKQSAGWEHYMLAFGLPAIAATLWGIFRIPNDPGSATVAIPGIVRLLLELGLFTLAVLALYDSGYQRPALIMAAVTFIHYVISYDRVLWMLKKKLADN